MKTLAFIVMMAILPSCSLLGKEEEQPPVEREVVVRTVEVKRQAPIIPPTDVFVAKDVQWVVFSKENAEERLEDGKAYFALDAANYQSLSENISSARVIIQQKQSVINSYERYFE